MTDSKPRNANASTELAAPSPKPNQDVGPGVKDSEVVIKGPPPEDKPNHQAEAPKGFRRHSPLPTPPVLIPSAVRNAAKAPVQHKDGDPEDPLRSSLTEQFRSTPWKRGKSLVKNSTNTCCNFMCKGCIVVTQSERLSMILFMFVALLAMALVIFIVIFPILKYMNRKPKVVHYHHN